MFFNQFFHGLPVLVFQLLYSQFTEEDPSLLPWWQRSA
jgi:hypothetical protein